MHYSYFLIKPTSHSNVNVLRLSKQGKAFHTAKDLQKLWTESPYLGNESVCCCLAEKISTEV